MTDDLYALPLAGASWGHCGSETPGDSDPTQDSCVEFCDIPGTDGAMAIRDTKRPDLPEQRYTRAELEAFARRILG